MTLWPLQCWFLDDRTNGRAYATVLRLSLVCDGIVREYVFLRFFKIQKRDFLRFLKCHVKKNVKT